MSDDERTPKSYDYPVRWLTSALNECERQRRLCEDSYNSLQKKDTRYALGMRLMADAHQRAAVVYRTVLAECPPDTRRDEPCAKK
jgi:hypothetical protein